RAQRRNIGHHCGNAGRALRRAAPPSPLPAHRLAAESGVELRVQRLAGAPASRRYRCLHTPGGRRMKSFSFSSTALTLDSYRQELADPAAGGYASFEGWVRNHNEGHAVTRLEYEAFEALANKEGERIVNEAIQRFGVLKAACVHRVGSLAIGDVAVWVGVSSKHRAEAFAACRYIIDEV